jgi:hypothetical protein
MSRWLDDPLLLSLTAPADLRGAFTETLPLHHRDPK